MRILLLTSLLLPLAVQAADSEQVERGRYLANAADCAACHTAEGGAEFAGGLPLDSPYGIIYGTNITPDKQHGIGNYSADDLFLVLTEGKRPDGAQLYPAMPYTSYRLITREDSDAIYAYLMSLAPVPRANVETDLSFPYNLRFGLKFWNLLYKDSVQLQPAAGNSKVWQQGQYLVEVLGHCGECHTPRNSQGALLQEQRLQGGVLGGYEAPSLLAQDLASRGWTPEDLAQFLKHGVSVQGSMFNEMFPVLHHSTQYLPKEDHQAMATYLLGDQPPAANVLTSQPLDKLGESAQRGRQDYLNVCAGCHGARGEGVPHVAVAMNGNTTLRLSNPRNLLRVIDDGIKEQQFTGFERMQPMPGFRAKLSDGQLGDLLNDLRQTWGGATAELTPQQVAELRGEAGE
ncbi:MAG TPA: cytochrome c [Pseudomonas sp.]|nr:cytochrome c [Pseudomonas sp.]